MKTIISSLSLLLFCCFFVAKSQAQIPYGNNASVGKYITINGVKHYYEVYGEGKPLLLIHGNKTGISGWSPQISYFSQKYKVYAIDCRGRGKSELGKDSLSYLQTAYDMAAFIEILGLDSVSVVGKSDGGIIGIMMGIYCPQHLKKIVAFGANMAPDSTALYPESVKEIHAERLHAEKMLASKDSSDNWQLVRLRNRMMEFQPHITAADLHKINIPVLVFSCDRDVIQESHTLFIYQNIPLASLCILGGETHYIAKQNPELFNTTVDKFLSQPFKTNAARFAH